MKNLNNFESEYEMINKYIDEAISLILKKKEFDCIRVLESLKLFSHSVLNAKNMLEDRNKN